MGETENAWASVSCVLPLIQGVPVLTSKDSPERILRRDMGSGLHGSLCFAKTTWLLGFLGWEGHRDSERTGPGLVMYTFNL